jgi:putative ATPase
MKPPLADELRPKRLEDVVGQDHILGKDGVIQSSISKGKPLSMILWGPPGCGKTSIARLYAQAFGMTFRTLSPIFSSIADLRAVVKEVKENPLFIRGMVLFVDEIHRFNKAQQDAFLPYVEDGTFTLIGATAENPSFYLNNALLSRLLVLKLVSLDEASLNQIINRLEEAKGKLPLTPEARESLIYMAQGDGRYILNMAESLYTKQPGEILDKAALTKFLQTRAALFDRAGDQHYNLISALHKSLRGSDPDAALYWFCRMLEGGEDPLFIARRLIRMASEDVGLADPQALQLAINAREAYETLGSPEGELAIAEAVVYLALSPKSNAIYTAYNEAKRLASETTQYDPPLHILNVPTKLMKQMGYGKEYRYDHDEPEAFSGQNYFPDEIERHEFYHPVERGFEREMIKRLDYFKKRRQG